MYLSIYHESVCGQCREQNQLCEVLSLSTSVQSLCQQYVLKNVPGPYYRLEDQVLLLQGESQFLLSLRHSNGDRAFAVIVFFLNDSVYGFNNNHNGRVKTGFQIIIFRRLWKFFILTHDFSFWHFGTLTGRVFTKLQPPIDLPVSVSPVKHYKGGECSAWKKLRSDAFETNSFVGDSIVNWLWSILSDEIYHG